ncbi:type IV secretion system protein IcmG [Legionella antarctica]|uniref:Type IV secretion system protein IcmG n=2 Tax=Legionella antarctica TaxID=2708020 RepID=A0A6F8T2A9_9GAMM|nr:type IV secretion system protein IcmG [Legionella antarctica]
MADNDQNNDEYQFAELDALDNESMQDESSLNSATSSTQGRYSESKNVKRNALIAVGVLVLAMVIYKIVGWIYSGKTDVDSSQTTVTPIAQVTPQPVQTTITPTPVPTIQQPQPVVTKSDTELRQKVSAIELSQQTVRAEVSSVGQQVGTVNNNINNLNAQIANLNQVIGNLSTQVAEQSAEINMLMSRYKPKPVKRVTPHIRVQRIVYYIQAVIPGRAWLIGSNGSTLTVREGTKIAGYGTVKLIDSMQGRVLTSSGQVIRFSQEDS